MRVIRFAIVPVLAVAWISYTGGSAMAAQHQDEHHHEMKAGKNGQVEFGAAVKVGDDTLTPGRYRIQHRVDGEQHFVHFKSMEHLKEFKDIQCKLEQLDNKAKYTSVISVPDGDGRRVTSVLVKGEDVAHIFEN